VPILSAGLDLGEKLPDPVDVFVWLLGMRTDLGPVRVRNQTMDLLGHPACMQGTPSADARPSLGLLMTPMPCL